VQQPGVALAQQVPHEVEVVVVQQHGRLPTGPVDLLCDGVSDQLLGCDVALLPRCVLGASQRRLQGQPVQPVLHEPQQRVGDHPVERLMHLGRDLDQTQRHRARPGSALPSTRVGGPRSSRTSCPAASRATDAAHRKSPEVLIEVPHLGWC